MRTEAADVVAECERCYVGNRLPPPVESSSSFPMAADPSSSAAVSRYDFPEHGTPLQASTPPTGSGAPDARRGSAASLPTDDSSPTSSSAAAAAQQPQPGHASLTASTISEGGGGGGGGGDGMPSRQVLLLEREIAVLRDNLNYEQHLRAQHNQHLGTLHRQHVLESGVEAERQTLYNKLRAYRDQLAQKTVALERARAEAATSKAMHIKWENDLGAKNRSLREEQRHWCDEGERLKADLAQAKV
jgi:hypothetical protein